MPNWTPRPAAHWRCLILLAGLGLAATTAAAAEGPLDFVFLGQARPARAPNQTGPVAWKVAEYSAVRLVPIEPAAPPNQHPATLELEQLRSQLAAIRVNGISRLPEPLFSRDELDELLPAIVTALQSARPEQDLVLLSTSRRGASFLAPPLSVTARLFMQDGALQVLVHDAWLDVTNAYRSTRLLPELSFGTRATPAQVDLHGPGMARRRPDWLALTPAAPPAPAPTAAVVSAAPPSVAPPASAPVPASLEQRLRTLKSLHAQGLISDEDYAHKRRELLADL
ncbi:MAG: hypothetical protein RLY71_3326 [Pseudomonadota bacterium]|jgi:hypothetical protein